MNQPVIPFKPKSEQPALASATSAQMPGKRGGLTLARASAIVAAVGVVAISLWGTGLTGASATAATALSAEVEGRVSQLLVADLQKVKKGDLLLQIDPTAYQVQVQQAEAAVLAAEAQIYSIENQILLQLRMVDHAMAGLALLEDERDVAGDVASLNRVKTQIAEKQAEIAAERGRIDVLSMQAQQANAELSSKRAGLDLAMIELDRTRIVAPGDGVVEVGTLREGQFVSAGAPLVSVTPIPKRYVAAGAHRI